MNIGHLSMFLFVCRACCFGCIGQSKSVERWRVRGAEVLVVDVNR